MIERLTRRAWLAPLALLVVACAPSPNEENARLSISLTDAPSSEVRSAVVTISEIALQGSMRVVLRNDPITVDLVDLAGTTQSLVRDATLPSGSYGQLRFVVDGAYIVTTDEAGVWHYFATDGYPLPPGVTPDGELRTPSWDHSGLKVVLPDDVDLYLEGTRDLVVDFDVGETFGHEAGLSDAWVMHPVLRAIDMKLTSTLDVAARMPPDDATRLLGSDAKLVARLTDGSGNLEATSEMTDPEGDGQYETSFRLLDPSEGPFSVEIEGPPGVALVLDPPVGPPIPVESGGAARAVFDVTASAAAP